MPGYLTIQEYNAQNISVSPAGDLSSSNIQSALEELDSDLSNGLALKSDISLTVNERTSNYTLILSDINKLIEMNIGSANNLTVPPNSSVSFPIGTTILVTQTGAGQTTVVAGSGVTVNSSNGLKLYGQWSSALLVKRATDTWLLSGDTTT